MFFRKKEVPEVKKCPVRKLVLIREFNNFEDCKRWVFDNFKVTSNEGLQSLLFSLLMQKNPAIRISVDLGNGSTSFEERRYHA